MTNEDPIVEAFRATVKGMQDGDKMLLDLCSGIIDYITTMNKEVLRQKDEIVELRRMYNKHFSRGVN